VKTAIAMADQIIFPNPWRRGAELSTQKEEIIEDLVYCSKWENAPKLYEKI
jgi:hypothetical protein